MRLFDRSDNSNVSDNPKHRGGCGWGWTLTYTGGVHYCPLLEGVVTETRYEMDPGAKLLKTVVSVSSDIISSVFSTEEIKRMGFLLIGT